MSKEAAVELFKSVVAEERWTQRAWHQQVDGRDYLCLAAAFGKPGEIRRVEQCPTGVLPAWLFNLMPTLDDGVGEADVPWLFRGFAERIDAMVQSDDETWEKIRTKFLVDLVRAAVAAAETKMSDPAPEYWTRVTQAADQVIAALQGDGDLAAAGAAARAAAEAAWAGSSTGSRGRGSMDSSTGGRGRCSLQKDCRDVVRSN